MHRLGPPGFRIVWPCVASVTAPRTIEHEAGTGSHWPQEHRRLHCQLIGITVILLEGLCTMSTLSGSCFCGEVKFEVNGAPAAMGYCHCESCRRWSAGPVNAFSLWKPESLKITHGAASVGTYNKTPISYRKWCTKCGGHVFTDHPTMGLVDIYAAMLPQLKFEPALHVNYQETVLRIKDGKPKMKDMPKEMGGSGVTLAE